MGFGSGNASFTRFKIIDEIPGQLWSEISGKLKLFAFQDIDNRPDERFWGWTNIDDMLDTSWQSSPPEKGHYLAFSLRLDTRRIAPAVFKKHYTLALREEEQKAKAEGHAFVSRLRHQELRQAVRQRLLQRSLPIPAEFNVIWKKWLKCLPSIFPKLLNWIWSSLPHIPWPPTCLAKISPRNWTLCKALFLYNPIIKAI